MRKKQLNLFENRGHGGKRVGAGRPRVDKTLQLHTKRPDFSSQHPGHVVIRLLKGLPSFRTKAKFKIIKKSILQARQKGLRIIHFSIQTNHIHLLIESENKEELAKGMQSFCTSLAKRINFELNKRKGRVFRDRYYLHVLKTLREVKNTLIYIFQNYAKHTKAPNRFDPFSTLICFEEKIKLGLSKVNTYAIFKDKKRREEFKTELNHLISPAESWFLRVGWKRA